MESSLTPRRVFLRFSSVFPFSLMAGSAAAASAGKEFCQASPEHPPVEPGDKQFSEAAAVLWEEFETGANALGSNPVIPQATKEHIFKEQGKPFRRKVRFFEICQDETKYCAFMAGLFSEAERVASKEDEISIDHFKIAKAAVRAAQAKRLGDAPVGIAC